MRVLFIHCYYQYKGGEDTVVQEEMQLLKSSGIITDLLAFSNEKNPLLSLIALPFNIKSYYKTLKRIRAFKPDMVHIHNLHFAASPSVVYAIKKCKIPFVITMHNYRLICPSALLFHNGKDFKHSLRQSFPWNAVMAKVYRNSFLITFWLSCSIKLHQLLKTWNNSKAFIVLSKYSKHVFESSFLGRYDNHFVIKPNFSYTNQNEVSNNSGNEFLFIGRLSEEKGIEILLQAFAGSVHKIKIAGDGPCREKVIDYAKRFSNIKFLGLVNKQEVLTLMQQCNALVFPSIWPEGMPLTIIEALSCSVPVVTSASGTMIDMITDEYNGLYFKTGNAVDLKEKLTTWEAYSRDEKNTFRRNALATYNARYTPEKNLVQLLQIYNSALPADKRFNIHHKAGKLTPAFT